MVSQKHNQAMMLCPRSPLFCKCASTERSAGSLTPLMRASESRSTFGVAFETFLVQLLESLVLQTHFELLVLVLPVKVGYPRLKQNMLSICMNIFTLFYTAFCYIYNSNLKTKKIEKKAFCVILCQQTKHKLGHLARDGR